MSADDLTARLDWLELWATYEPQRLALHDVETGERLSYAALHSRELRMAEALRAAGVVAGDRVAVLGHNHADFVPLFFATARLGAVLVPLNFRLAPVEIAEQLALLDARILLHDTELGHVLREIPAASRPAQTQTLFGPGSFADDWRVREARVLPQARSTFDAPCLLLFTSGSTGRPKAVQITRRMIVWNAINTSLRLDLRRDDSTVGFLPFFHTGAWNVLLFPLLQRGGAVHLAPRFDPAQVLAAIARERTTVVFGVPTTMARMAELDDFETLDLSAVRFAVVGGEPMPETLIQAWHDAGVPVRQGYGLTEFGPNVFSLEESRAVDKIGSIGRPNPGVALRLLGEDGEFVPMPGTGELLLRGAVATPGYWRDPEATAALWHEGWLRTGDVVRVDEDGFAFVVGRVKDMYISGGENVFPSEVERALREHPSVAETAVVGVPDATWGEVGLAFVVAAEGASLTRDDLIAFCRGRLAGYKAPRHVVFRDGLPKSDAGKIDKRRLRAEARAEVVS